MSPHAPFIIAAYAVAAVLLAWCALVPVIQGRKLAKQLRLKFQRMEEDDAPNP